jgi:hypothetical protein
LVGLGKDHAVAVSHLAATPYRAKIKHHIRGRNFDANGIRITVGLGALRRWVLRHPEGTGRALWSTSWHEIIGAEYDHRRIRVLRTHGTVLVFLPARSSSVPDIAGELRGHGVRVEQVDRVGSSLT